MRVCIFGTSGFLSSKLIEYLIKINDEIIIFGRKYPKFDASFDFFEIDLLNLDIPIEICLKADLIIYAAALGVQSSQVIKATDIYKINTLIPISLIENLKLNNFKGKVVTFGSYFEIGSIKDKDSCFNEVEIVFSKAVVPNEYCLSKRLATRYFFDSKIPFKFYHCILPTIYGVGEKVNRLIPYLINSLIDKKEIRLSSGNQIRQYLLIDDAIEILFKLITGDVEEGIYNFPCAETVSVKQVATIIYDSFGASLNQNVFGKELRKDESMSVLKLNSEKIGKKIEIGNLTTLANYIINTNHSKWN